MTTANRMRKIGKKVRSLIPQGYGFTVLVFPFNRPGLSNYISSAQRKDMITALRETADRLEHYEDFSTPEEN